MSSTVYDITFTICVTTQNVCISDLTHSMLMTYALYMASHTVLWQHNHCVTSQPLCLTSHPLYLCHHTKWINFIMHNDITATMCMTSYALYVTSHPQFRTSHHFMYGIRSTLSDLTSCVSLSSHPPYRWYYSHYMYDITSNIYVISHSLYLWHNTH